MSQSPSLHMLQTCPFCWKVRGMTDYLKMDVNQVQVNAMKTKKELAFAGDWGKVPVWTSSSGEVVVDSTPILKYIWAHHAPNFIFAPRMFLVSSRYPFLLPLLFPFRSDLLNLPCLSGVIWLT